MNPALLRRGRFGGSAAKRFAAIPKLVDTSAGVVFQSTALDVANTDDPVGFALNTAQGAGYSGGELTGLGPELWDAQSVLLEGGFAVSGDDIVVDNDEGAWGAASLLGVLEAGNAYLVHIDVIDYTSGRVNVGLPDWGESFAEGTHTMIVTATGPDFVLVRHGYTVQLTVSNISIRNIPGTQAVTPNSSARPTLQADGSLRHDGVDDQITFAAPVGGFPSNCEVFVMVTSDTPSGTKVVALDGETGYIGFGLSGSTDTAINSGVGATTTFFDGAAMTTRGDLYTALLGMGVLNARSADLSAYGELSISGAAARARGDVGGVVIYDNTNGPLTDAQRADIHAVLLGGVS